MTDTAQISRFQAWASSFERLLNQFVVRVVLSIAIIVSLMPMSWVARLDVLFFAIFGSEFVLRVLTLLWGGGRKPPDPEPGLVLTGRHSPSEQRRPIAVGAVALLVVDLIALLSFLPIETDAIGARWLRVFRLTRMLLLVGYWAPLVRDLWSILARRERSRQLILMGFVVFGLSFAGAVILYHLDGGQVDVTDDGVVDAADRSFLNLLWWSFRQVQDPGNMLASPMALPVVLISVALTVFGLFLVSFLIGLGTDVVHELLELSRLRPSGLRGHSVIINITPPTRRLLFELRRYYRKLLPTDARPLSFEWFRDLRRRGLLGTHYLVVGHESEPPDFLRQPELTGIVYRQRGDDEEELVRRADLVVAKRIVLLADLEDSAPDAETIRTLVTVVERIRSQERAGRLTAPLGRRRVIIAEILDESNVPAAQAALATGLNSFRGFVVPTEKLLALFFASIVRRPGLEQLLEELLTSHGHEIYTCFFDTPGLGFSLSERPDLGTDAAQAIDRILERGLRHPGRSGCVIPVGLLTHRDASAGQPDFDVCINPQPGDAEPGGRLRGFVAVGANFRAIREMAEHLADDGASSMGPLPRPNRVVPQLTRTHRRKTTRVLICGFRSGSIYMLEELFRSDPQGELLVMVEDEHTRDKALDAMISHSQLVRRGLMHGRHGIFEPQPDGQRVLFRFNADSSGPACVMHMCTADWMESRHLVDLPAGFGHVVELDAIIFVASDPETTDKRTSTTLLKVEQLFAADAAGRRPRVVAEVIDSRLAARLNQRYRELAIQGIRVFSIQELRAYFLFQSVVVPGFDRVYAELLGSWGQSFVHQDVVGNPQGLCTFGALAFHLRRQGQVLVAVELLEPDGEVVLCVAPHAKELGSEFELSTLRGVWVIAPDSHVQPARVARNESHLAKRTAASSVTV